MVEGRLSAATKAKTVFPAVAKPAARAGRSGPNGYLVDVVRNELVNRGIVSEDQVLRGGCGWSPSTRKPRWTRSRRSEETGRIPARGRTSTPPSPRSNPAMGPSSPCMAVVTLPPSSSTMRPRGISRAVRRSKKAFTLVGALQKDIIEDRL